MHPTNISDLIARMQLRQLRGESVATREDVITLLQAPVSGRLDMTSPATDDPPSLDSVAWALNLLSQAWANHDPWAEGEPRRLMSRHAGLTCPTIRRRLNAIQERCGVFLSIELDTTGGSDEAFVEGVALGAAWALLLPMLSVPPEVGAIPGLNYLEHAQAAPQILSGLALAQALKEGGTDTKAALLGSPDEADAADDPQTTECGGGDHPALARAVWRDHLGQLVRQAGWRSDVEVGTIYWPELYGRQTRLGAADIAGADLGTLLSRLWPKPLVRRYVPPSPEQRGLQRSRRQRVPHPRAQAELRDQRGDAFVRRLLLASRAIAVSEAGSRWMRLGSGDHPGSRPSPQTRRDLRDLLTHPLWQTSHRQSLIVAVLAELERA